MVRARKITPHEFLNSLMFSLNDQSNSSLIDIVADVNKEFNIDISKEAIHKKFTPQAVDFFKNLLRDQMSQKLNYSTDEDFRKYFKSIKVKDSTKFALCSTYQGSYPSFNNFSKKKGVMNVQYEYDLISGKWNSLELTSIKDNDQKNSKTTVDQLEKQDLYIRDLGYISASYLRGVQKAEAFFLNRMPPQASMYNSEGKNLNWTAIDKDFKEKELTHLDIEGAVYQMHRIKCRVVVIPVNKAEARVRLKKAKQTAKSQGVGLTKNHRIRCRYKVFITNVSKELISVEQIKQTYRLRWQIELVFKTWKSFFSINKVKRVKKERLECQLLAKLLWIIINWDLFRISNQYVKNISPKKGISILKFFKKCNMFTYTLRLVMLKKMRLKHWLKSEFLPLIEHTLCEGKGKKPTSYEILNAFLTSLS